MRLFIIFVSFLLVLSCARDSQRRSSVISVTEDREGIKVPGSLSEGSKDRIVKGKIGKITGSDPEDLKEAIIDFLGDDGEGNKDIGYYTEPDSRIYFSFNKKICDSSEYSYPEELSLEFFILDDKFINGKSETVFHVENFDPVGNTPEGDHSEFKMSFNDGSGEVSFEGSFNPRKNYEGVFSFDKWYIVFSVPYEDIFINCN